MVRIVKAKGNKQRRVPLAAKTLVQLQAYIDANEITAEAPIFPIAVQWVRAIINKYGA
jgi:site-specific recombinase XerC